MPFTDAGTAPLPALPWLQPWLPWMGAQPPATATPSPPPHSGVHYGHHAHGGDGRDYRLFVPELAPEGAEESAEARRATPRPALIVMLHGCTQDPDDFARGTRMDAVAARHAALVLYPQQCRRASAKRCWNWFDTAGDEPAILAAMTRQVIASQAVDPARVFVAGLSAGGAMAALLGARDPGLFAAIGVHSGLPAAIAHDLRSALLAMKGRAPALPASPDAGSRVPRTIVFHGNDDRVVHPVNAEQLMAQHCHRAARLDDYRAAIAGRQVARRVARQADGRAIAEHWQIASTGHAWSGGDPAGSFTDPEGPDASAEFARFFLTSD